MGMLSRGGWWRAAGILAFGGAALSASAQVAPPASHIIGGEGPLGVTLAPVRGNEPLTMNALLGFVNDEPIFVQDMLRPVDGQLRAIAKSARDLSDFRQQARPIIEAQLKRYITDIAVNSTAKDALTDEEKTGLDHYMAIQRHDLIVQWGGGSEARAEQALRATGSSVDKTLSDVRRHLVVMLYIRKELAPRVVITRQMVLDDYQRNAQQWHQDPEIELFTITLPITRWLREPGVDGKLGPFITDPAPAQIQKAQAQAMAAANEIEAKLRSGQETFAQLAEDYSSDANGSATGGRYPNVKRGSMANSMVEDFAFSLPANTLGKPLLVKNSDPTKTVVMVIKVGEKKEARTVPFSEAEAKIREKLRSAQMSTLTDQFFNKLEGQSAIENQNRMLDTAMDVAEARFAAQ